MKAKVMMLFPLLLLMLLLAVHTSDGSKNPGFKARITTKGLNYANDVAIQALVAHVKKTKIPDISGDHSGFHYKIENIHVTSFNPPKSTLSLLPGSGLSWKAANANIDLHGDFHVKKWFIKTSGSFDADISSLSFDIGIAIGSDPKGRPTIKSKGCRSSVGNVNFKFHGGMAWLFNLFRGKVGHIIKDNLDKQLCSTIVKEIDVDGNKQLAKLPLSVPLAKKFLLEYGLMKPPLFTPSYMETFHKGDIKWLASPDQASPLVAPAMSEPKDTRSMVYFEMSEYVFNTAADMAQKHDFLRFNLTAKKLPAQYRGLLNTTCTGLMPKCIGKLIPKIGKKYPHGSVELRMVSTKAPDLEVSTSGLTVSCEGDILNYANIPGKKETPFLFEMFANMTTTVNVSVKDGRIYVKINKLSLDLEAKNSTVGKISPALIDIVKDAIKVVVVQQLNDLGAKGFPLPITKDIAFVGTRLQLSEDTIMIATDLKYKPSARRDVTMDLRDVIIDQGIVISADEGTNLAFVPESRLSAVLARRFRLN